MEIDQQIISDFNALKNNLHITADNYSEKKDCLILTLQGSLETQNSNGFGNILTHLLQKSNFQIIAINCKDLSYISSTGIGAFMSFQIELFKQKKICYFMSLSESIKDIFSTLGFTGHIQMINSLTEIK